MKELLSKSYVKNILKEQYEYALKKFGDAHVFGIFVYGDVNYNMGYEDRDIHTEIVYLPTFEELCLSHRHNSQTFIYKHRAIHVVDARDIYHAIFNGRLEIVESLYTDLYIVNPRYKYQYDNFFKIHRDAIAQHNKTLRLKTAAAIGLKALDSYVENLNSYQLYKAQRALYFCENYATSDDFEFCLKVPEKDREYYYRLRFEHNFIENKEDVIMSTSKRLNRFIDMPNEELSPLSEKTTDDLTTAILSIMKKVMDKMDTRGFLNELSGSERRALESIFDSIHLSGEVSISALTNKSGVSRQSFSSLFNKIRNNGVATIEGHGVRGTAITFLDENIIDLYYEGDY